MATVSILYFSGSGRTANLAAAVSKGAASVEGVKTNRLAIESGRKRGVVRGAGASGGACGLKCRVPTSERLRQAPLEHGPPDRE